MHVQAAGSGQPHLLPVNEKTPSFARKIAKLVPMAAYINEAYVKWACICIHHRCAHSSFFACAYQRIRTNIDSVQLPTQRLLFLAGFCKGLWQSILL